MLVITDLEASKADLATIEECELRQVRGGVGLGSLFGSGISVISLVGNIPLSPGGFGGNNSLFGGGISNSFPTNPAISPLLQQTITTLGK